MSESSKAVFLSYASLDAEPARRICESLRAAGVEVWFDQNELVGGDAWDAKIRGQIAECALFVPVISAATQTRPEGHFRIEWELAAKRAMEIAPGVEFIVPIVIDETPEPAALVPDCFRRVPWMRLMGGVVAPEVQQRLVKLWSNRGGGEKEREARATPPPSVSSSRPPGFLKRRGLAAILFTDVVGYSARVQRDEQGALALVEADFALMREYCTAHDGEVLNSMGDGLLMCFASAVQAVVCALELQEKFSARQTRVGPTHALEHRMGVHIGDVFRPEAGGVAGDGVNIAARLQTRAPPGGICISQMVHETVKGKVPMQAVFLGPESFKNIAEPILIWHIAPERAAALTGTIVAKSAKPDPSVATRPRRTLWWIGGGLAAAAALAFLALRPTPVPSPAAETRTTAAAPVRSEAKALPGEKSIAVLPFENRSEDKDSNAFFADGIQEDVLTNLGALRDLRVISRTSVAQYRNTTKSIRQIGEELRALYVLEGSVRRAGKAVRVTGQLIRAATDEQVWSKSYDRDITDIFAVQSELAQDIARALQAALSPQEKATLARRPTESIAAYEAYLKARERMQRHAGLGRLVSAVALLEQALALDPNFALAWAELGDVNARFAFEEWDRTPARLAAARAAIETALRLAPEDPGVIAKLGLYYLHSDRDYARASEQYLRLAALRPNDAEVLRALGRIRVLRGRWAEGVADLQRAFELDPGNRDGAVYLIRVLTAGRRYAEAEALARRLEAAFPESINVAMRLAANAFLARGSTSESEAFSRRNFHDAPPQLFAYQRRMLARLRGDTAEAIRLDRESPYWDGADHPWAQETAAAVTLADAGDLVAARARAASALAIMEAERPRQQANSWLFAWMGMAQALLGRKEEAIASARHALEILPESRDAVFGVENALVLASVYAWVGERDLALAEFARLLKTPQGANVFAAARGSISVNVPVSFKPLWDDPQFRALLADPKNNEPLF